VQWRGTKVNGKWHGRVNIWSLHDLPAHDATKKAIGFITFEAGKQTGPALMPMSNIADGDYGFFTGTVNPNSDKPFFLARGMLEDGAWVGEYHLLPQADSVVGI